MQWRAVACLLLLVGSTGCLATPFGEPAPQDEPAPVMLVNNATQTEIFEIAVVEVGQDLTITWGNETLGNTTGYISLNSGSFTYHKGGLLRVDLPDSARGHGEYTLEPGERKQVDVENVAPNDAIVVLVYDVEDQTYRVIKSLSCSGPVSGYRVTTQSGGSEDWTMSTHQCG